MNGPDNCWEWIGWKAGGYGMFYLAPLTVLAHRVAWVINFGKIPEGICVCHHCDNPACVNPSHLFLGTVLDNNMDKIKKGRANMPSGENNGAAKHPEKIWRGEQCHTAKLTSEDVRKIKARLANGERSPSIKRDFPISLCGIQRIKYNKTWRHV
jgi:hypothetical protein